MTEQERKTNNNPEVWFMRTIFSQFVEKWKMTPEEMAEDYGYRFMPVSDSLIKIHSG